ncbi:beta-N-acetylhexosaminidase [Clostridium sp.]|uniref:beta-N-acetylhexosaminidase n=1 Tax=Clostridium sp. TaxID=1506 RepID=UPI00321707AF
MKGIHGKIHRLIISRQVVGKKSSFLKHKDNITKVTLITIMIAITFVILCGCGIVGNHRKNGDSNNVGNKGNKKEELQQEKDRSKQVILEPVVDLVQEKLDAMTLEEKIGQLFIVGFNGCEANEEISHMIKDRHVGGVIFFSENIDTVVQTKGLIENLNSLNSKNPLKLFISLDEEGGIVSRIPKEMGSFESAWDVGARGDLDYSFNHGRLIGETVKSLGFNLDFAPVLDVNSNSDNPVIGIRAFSDDPQVVKVMGTEVFKGIRSAGVIAVGKHFPGHGDTDVDSHVAVPVINKSIDELKNIELIPFKYAIDNGIDMIMVGHLYLPQLDDKYVSSLSKKIITGILRQELGFNGVVITDDMIMEGVKRTYTTRESAVKAIEAGNDIIIVSRAFKDQEEAIDGLLEAVKSGVISEKRIDESVYRIINLKKNI